jgi:hypothetical protein
MSERRGRRGPGLRSSKPWRTPEAAVLSLCFPAAAWFVGGPLGLTTGVVVVACWWGLRPRVDVLWALSVLLLALTPLAILVEGLPQGRVVGSGFGAEHLLAHRLVVVSLVLAAFAAFTELLVGHDPARAGPRTEEDRPPRD